MKTLSLGILLSAIVISSMTLSCENDSYNMLYGKWNLFSVEDDNASSPIEYPDSIDTKISIILTDSSIVLLEGFCNSGSGNYHIDGEKISFNNLWMTEMGCLMSGWEEYFLKLGEANSYTLEQKHLSIFTNSDIRVLNFIKAE